MEISRIVWYFVKILDHTIYINRLVQLRPQNLMKQQHLQLVLQIVQQIHRLKPQLQEILEHQLMPQHQVAKGFKLVHIF
ncbi:hypothetical protein NPIL_49551 [Nephila pilipes]|uniref:Uncharacterized protein n=1 Tax=Nephila pilipes TaxID=299642 RepID=A0A8X6QHI1_NEPPI|nr:hypothetical protein NPIL_49551 [Nephila pilipes]